MFVRNVLSRQVFDFVDLKNSLNVAVWIRTRNIVRAGHHLERDVLGHALKANKIIQICV